MDFKSAPTVLPALFFAPLLFLAYQIARSIYNVFFHPLRKFPGPLTSAVSTLPTIFHTVKGNHPFWICSLHAKYGEVIRISPNELSFSGPDAFRDIYGHKTASGRPTLPKEPSFYRGAPGETHNIASAASAAHSRMRRIFSNAFSDRALKLQEPLFVTYVDRLVRKLREGYLDDKEKKYDIAQLYAYTTFDVMSDLTFGEPLNLLEDNTHRPWVAAMYANFKYGAYLQCIRYFPVLEYLLLRFCMPKSIVEKRGVHHRFTAERVDRRIARVKDARPDIWGLVLQREEDGTGLTREEGYANANTFMIAGTETTATLLSGVTYHLLKSPERMGRLVKEIRQAFDKEEDITMERLQGLRYLHACLEEGLRMYPPVPFSLPRVAQPGTTVDGRDVPPETRLGVPMLAAFRNPENFRSPSEFVPERWLPEESSFGAEDRKQAFQPFSLGPRGCLGKNMAYHEMRLILTRVLFNFDLVLCPECERWSDQKIFLLWMKDPLWCQVVPVKR